MFIMLVHVGLISLTVVMGSPYRRLLFSDLIAPSLALLGPPLFDAKAQERNCVMVAPARVAQQAA